MKKTVLGTLILCLLAANCSGDTMIPNYDNIGTITDSDLSLWWDTSDTSSEYPLGKLKKATGAEIIAWIATHGLGTESLLPAPSGNGLSLLRVNSGADGFEAVSSFNADIGNLTPSMAVYSDASGKLQPHPDISAEELQALDNNRGNLQAQIDNLTVGNNKAMSVSVGTETTNTITAAISFTPVDNYMFKAWLASDAVGTPTTAFDGNGGDPMSFVGGSVYTEKAVNAAYELFTGSDGALDIEFRHSDAASPLTKYLCTELDNVVDCHAIAFTTSGSPCAAFPAYTQDDSVAETGFSMVKSGLHYLAQKMKGDGQTHTVCGVTILSDKEPGVAANVHVEIWTAGTNGTDGATMSGTAVQIGGDSDVLTVTHDGAPDYDSFVWSANKPVLTGGDFYVHVVNAQQSSVFYYWKSTYDETKYEDTNHDMMKDGVDQSADGWFILSVQ